MNRPLRKAHFWLVALLTPAAIGILAASIAARRAIPPNATPAQLSAPMAELQETGHRSITVGGALVELRGLVEQSGKRFLEISLGRDPHVADLLAYIGPGKNAAFDDKVRLLGSVYASCPVRYPLPEDSTQTLSEIYLYSGATRTVVGRVSLTDSSGAGP